MTKPKKKTVLRLSPTKETIRILFARSANSCAFPNCTHRLIDDEDTFVAQICHIEAAVPGGERFNKKQSNEERRHSNNLILLCYEHHVKTNNVKKYDVAALKQMKMEHEKKSSASFIVKEEIVNSIYNELLSTVQEIKVNTISILDHSIKAASDLDSIRNGLNELLSRVPERVEVNELPELKTIRDFRNSQKQQSALTLIESVKSSKWNSLSSDLKSRITINEAICYLDLENDKKAAQLFIEALQWKPTDEHALSYAAFGYSVLGNKRKALTLFKKSIKIDPKNVNAYLSFVHLNQEKPIRVLLESIPDDVINFSEVCFNLGLVARKQNDFETSINLFQRALENRTEERSEYYGALGSTIIESVSLDMFSFVTGQISLSSKAKARYSIELLSKGWELIKETDLKFAHADLLINRAVAKKYLNDYKGAFDDIKAALEIKPDSFFMLRHFIIVCFETERVDIAMSNIDKLLSLSNENEILETKLLMSELLLTTNKFQEAIDLLENVNERKNELKEKDRRYLEHNLLLSYVRNKQGEKAYLLINHLISTEPDEVSHYVESALLYYLQEDLIQSRHFADEAFKRLRPNALNEDILELSQIYSKLSVFDRSNELLEKITDKKVYSRLTKNLIVGYFRAGTLNKALKILDLLENEYGIDRFLAEYQCAVYESTNNIPKAIEVCNRYLKINPDDQVMLIHLAFDYDRLEDSIAVSETLDKIVTIDLTLSFGSLFRLASILAKYGKRDRALNLAYETRRANFNVGNCHLNYFSFINELNVTQQEAFLELVSVGACVYLSPLASDRPQTIYVVEERDDILSERYEIDETSSLGLKLMNKRIGDLIEVDKDFGIEQFSIRSITSKYFFAYNESIQLLSTRFIDQPGFQVFNTKRTGNVKEDLKPVFDALDQGEKFEAELNKLYLEQKVTIGFYSKVHGASPIRTISVLSTNPQLGLYPTWNVSEFLGAKGLLESNSDIIVDLTSIVLLASINRLSLLELVPNRIVIAQSSFDIIRDQIEELKGMASGGFISVGKMNGQYVRDVVSEDQVQKFVAHFNGLVDWIKEHCSIEPSLEALNINVEKKKEMDGMLGQCFYDTILLAKQKNGLFLCDESILRQIAFSEFGVKGIHIFILQTYLIDKKKISSEDSSNLLIDLFSLNLKGLPVDERTLVAAAKRSRYASVYPFSLLVSGLGSNLLSNQLATTIAVNFLVNLFSDGDVQLYSSMPASAIRQNLAMPVLTQLFKRNSFQINMLLALVELKFKLLQPQKDELFEIINAIGKTAKLR